MSTIPQIRQQLMRQLAKAADAANQKILAKMLEETWGFYSGGDPVMYQRTGALGDTPRTTAVSIKSGAGGASATFTAYLDTNHSYTTGCNPSMKTVLTLANNGGSMSNPPMRSVVGNTGFWDRAKDSMQDILDETVSQYF